MTSLRRAKLDDHWKTSFKRKYSCVLDGIRLNNGRIFEDVYFELKPGINSIIGKNGIGKSNLIRSIFNLLASDRSNRNRFPKLVDDCDITASISFKGETFEISSVDPRANGDLTEDIVCLIFDPCNLVPEIQNLFVEQDNVEELLEVFSWVELSANERKVTNFLLNSNYKSIKIVNIEDEYLAFPMLPFFVVEKDGATYDSRSMGLGELSLLYFFWLTQFIEREDRPCILLIEEPESFLPPLVQERLCDIFAKTASEFGVFTLISTHSEHILRRIPRSHMHVMARMDSRVVFMAQHEKIKQLQVLGLGAPKSAALLFEDLAALELCKALIKRSTMFVVDSFYYHISGSDGEILKDIERFPSGIGTFPVSGVFDGDADGKLQKQLSKLGNYAFLPTDQSPEEIILAHIDEKSDAAIAQILGVSTPLLSAAREAAAGTDHHDYFYDFARAIGREFKSVFMILCDAWVNDPANDELVQTFLTSLNQSLGQAK